ncbi:MAG: hypothetical protein BEN18_03890 [Epulopiscium sp. Nuni2H_MBin001]|nr:MAG: hypothetical protein BEN18_03890 [Epulopiscium sp. Nuni2H_MBin001]
MWIKKLFNSLYASIVLRMTMSVVIGCVLTVLLLVVTNQYSLRKNMEFWRDNSREIELLVEQIETSIHANNMTFKQAKDNRFLEISFPTDCRINFFTTYSDIFDEIDYLYELEMFRQGYYFELDFMDGNGFMVVYSDKIESLTDLLILLSFVAGIILFFVMSIYLIFKKLDYIKVIEKGIYNISHEDILYKIPMEGNNELTRLASSINDMGDMLSSKIEQERENEIAGRLLITNMSHDLKTPLTSMIGYIDVIESKLSKDHEVYPLIITAKKNGLRLEKLIADLFLYSKLISKDIVVNIQSININVMLKQILEIRTENIILKEVDTNLLANVDPEKFHRIIDNLISNASKYGVKDELITMSIGENNDEVVIEIQNLTHDNLENKVDKLTTRLYTAREDRTNGSSGLGLSIVIELLKTMKGRLKLACKGDMFTATINLVKS